MVGLWPTQYIGGITRNTCGLSILSSYITAKLKKELVTALAFSAKGLLTMHYITNQCLIDSRFSTKAPDNVLAYTCEVWPLSSLSWNSVFKAARICLNFSRFYILRWFLSLTSADLSWPLPFSKTMSTLHSKWLLYNLNMRPARTGILEILLSKLSHFHLCCPQISAKTLHWIWYTYISSTTSSQIPFLGHQIYEQRITNNHSTIITKITFLFRSEKGISHHYFIRTNRDKYSLGNI